MLHHAFFVIFLAISVHGDAEVDWLIKKVGVSSHVVDRCWQYADKQLCGVEISNGLISRRFVTSPAFGTIDYILNASTPFGGEQSMFRTVKPEAQITLNGTAYNVGGLTLHTPFLTKFHAYCNRSDFNLDIDKSAFHYVSHSVSSPVAPFAWTPGTRYSPKYAWPPKGKTLIVKFVHPSNDLSNFELNIYYEIYDNIPLLAKWMTLDMVSDEPDSLIDTVIVDAATVELFGAMPRYGAYLTHGSFFPMADSCGPDQQNPPASLLHSKTDQAHGAQCQWLDDWPNSADPIVGCMHCKDEGAVEPYLNCSYTTKLGAYVGKKENFVSFRTLELATDSTNIERQSLSRHRLTQLLAPHTTENPIFFHFTKNDTASVKRIIDQMAVTGFEMLIYSFGSGFNLETNNNSVITEIKEQVDYAKSKGIEVGGYDLICLDRGKGFPGDVGDQWTRIDKDGSLTGDACFASGWYDKLRGLVLNFINQTGLSMLETDGPYSGNICHSTDHAHHHGASDSVYRQTQLQNRFYHEMRALNVYINQPDTFFFQGGNRKDMGYSEEQYSLPRWRDISISRMGLYDDLYTFLPTQGWMFLPLIEYEGGGDDAIFINDYDAYEWGLAQYLGAGIAACYRGNAVYQDDRTKKMVIKWVSFYKKHRSTLIQPIIHLRRPNMQGWDGWLHVNPLLVGDTKNEVGLAMLFNPTDTTIHSKVHLPLYYCGLSSTSLIAIDDQAPVRMDLTKDYSILITIQMLPRSIHTIVINL